MADEAAQTETTAESVHAAADAAQATDQNQDGEGTHYIDFDKLPPEVHARFKRLYKHTKDSERRETLMATQLRDAFQQIEDLRSNVTTAKKADVLTDLKAQKVAALDAGDSRRVVELDDKIAEVNAMRVAPRKVDLPKVEASDIPDEDGDAFAAWSDEKNSDGSVKRPWANPKHEDHEEAAQIGASVFSSKKFKDRPVEDKLAEIDRRMNLANGTVDRSASTVLSSNSGGRPAQGRKAGLSPDEKRIAERMFESVPAGKAHELYLTSKNNLYGARA